MLKKIRMFFFIHKKFVCYSLQYWLLWLIEKPKKNCDFLVWILRIIKKIHNFFGTYVKYFLFIFQSGKTKKIVKNKWFEIFEFHQLKKFLKIMKLWNEKNFNKNISWQSLVNLDMTSPSWHASLWIFFL